MNSVKNRKFLISFLLAIILLGIVFSLVYVIDKYQDTKKSVKSVYSPYVFDTLNFSRFDDDNSSGYENENFEIKNAAGLHEFSVSVAYGYSFEGKNVYLSNDIDMSDWNWQPIGASMDSKYNGEKAFSGTFDGNNHTISNLNTYINNTTAGSGGPILGLFSILRAETSNVIVKNVRLQNMNFNYDEDRMIGNYTCYVGGIAGQAEIYNDKTVTIENCIVENLTALSKENGVTHRVCGLIGAVRYFNPSKNECLIVQNCLTSNISVGSGSTGTFNVSGFFESNGCTIDGNGYSAHFFKLYDCVSTASKLYTSYKNVQSNQIYSGNHENAKDVYNSNFGTWSNCSSNGGTKCETGKDWYYDSRFKSGIPYLRAFMSWATASATKWDSNGFQSTVTATVPDDSGFITELDNSINGSTLRTISLGGTSVTTVIVSGYTFKKWDKTANLTYKAVYKQLIYTLNFATVNGVAPSQSSITVTAGQKFTVSIAYSSTSTVVSYTINSQTVTYTFLPIYTIDSYGNVTNSSGTSVLTVVNQAAFPSVASGTYTLTPTIKLKSYNATFQ